MTTLRWGLGVMVALTFALGAVPASAMSLKDCSVLYQAAKKDGSLGTRNWDEFRTAECPMNKPVPAKAEAAAAVPAEPPAKAKAAAAGSDVAASTAAVHQPSAADMPEFPSVIDPKYAAEKPTRGRLHTCSDSYQLHKKAKTLNGLRWIQPGGGFYSLCVKKLKASA